MEINCLKEVSLLDKRFQSFSQDYRQNIVILGDDKEEISYRLNNYLKKENNFTLCFIHTTTLYVDQKGFIQSVILSLLSNYLNKEANFDLLINFANNKLPLTITHIQTISRKPHLTLLDALEIINIFIQETQQKCVLIIEEFTKLKQLFPNCYQEFSQFLILQRNCMVILTSCLIEDTIKILKDELNLLFGNFEKIHLNDIDFATIYKYMKSTFRKITPSHFFFSFFAKIFGTNISYYDMLKEKTLHYYSLHDEISSIVTLLETIFYNQNTYLYQKFYTRINLLENTQKDTHLMIKLLLAISSGYLRKKELNSLQIYKSNKELTPKIQKLIELGYLINLGDLYRVKDPLFSFWLNTTFRLSFSPAIINPQKHKQMWQKKVIEELQLFAEDLRKDNFQKITELITTFKGDTLKQGKIKYKLPFIEKTKIISYPEKDIFFLIGEGEEIIFAAIKEKQINDSDIFDFVEKSSNLKGKKVKKVFISFTDCPSITKLVGKNHKLTIWDANEINYLLNIYNKAMLTEKDSTDNQEIYSNYQDWRQTQLFIPQRDEQIEQT